MAMCSSRRIEKCPQSGWGCMGGGATDQCLEGHPYPVQLYVRAYVNDDIFYYTAGPGVDFPRGDGP